MSIPCWLIALFWSLALVVSFLLGWFCLEVHNIRVPEGYPRAARNHQRWFNFIGALVGWIALWCLVRRAWCVWWACSSLGQAGWSDFVLGFVAFVGISGYFPYATMTTVDAIGKRVAKLLTEAS
jgi:hypothetical protein